MSADILKKLKVKTGVVTRTRKELVSYHTEVERQKEKIAKLVAAGADEYDIKKQREVLTESEAMIDDTNVRLERAIQDLQTFVNANKSAIAGSTELEEAQKAIAGPAAPAAATTTSSSAGAAAAPAPVAAPAPAEAAAEPEEEY